MKEVVLMGPAPAITAAGQTVINGYEPSPLRVSTCTIQWET
jgi:hypothetical protein